MAQGLHQAVMLGRLRHVKFLIDSGVNVNKRIMDGQTPLITALRIACPSKRFRIFKYLVSRGSDCCAVDSVGRDVLSWACLLRRENEVRIILSCTMGDLNFCHQDQNGRTALHYAAISGNSNIVRMLVQVMRKYAISVDITDNWGMTPYMHASGLGFTEIAYILVEEGRANPSVFDTETIALINGKKSAPNNNKSAKANHSKNRLITRRLSLEESTLSVTSQMLSKGTVDVFPIEAKYGFMGSYTIPSADAAQSHDLQPSHPPVRTIRRELTGLLDLYSQQLSAGYRRKASPKAAPPPKPRCPSASETGVRTSALALMFAAKMKKARAGRMFGNKTTGSSFPPVTLSKGE